MMIKSVRNLLRAFCKEHATTQNPNKSKLLVYDEFLKKYVSVDELLIPREVYKEKDDTTLLQKKSRELLLFDLLLKKFVNPKLDLLTPGIKDQRPNIFHHMTHDNTCKSGRRYFWKKKKEGVRNHNIPALPPVHDAKSKKKESNSPRYGWASQPTRSPESDPRPEPSNTNCNINSNNDPNRSKPSKKKKQNKQLKFCGKEKQNKNNTVEQLKPVEFQRDECYHNQKVKSGFKIYSKNNLYSFKDKGLRQSQKEKFNVLEMCAQRFAGRKYEMKKRVHEKSNTVTNKEIEKKKNKNATLENKQINKFVQESDKINNNYIDSEVEATLTKCNNNISKIPNTCHCNKEIVAKRNICELYKTDMSVNSAKLSDTSENFHSKPKMIKQKDKRSCSHKLDKQEYCNSSCTLENGSSKAHVVNSKQCLNGKNVTDFSDITINKPIENVCKKNVPEEKKSICRQINSKNKDNELLPGNNISKNCNLIKAKYNFMAIPKSMIYSPSLKPSLKTKTDNCNANIDMELKANPKFIDDKSIKMKSDGKKCLKNVQTTKVKDQRPENKEIFPKKEQTFNNQNQIIKSIPSVPDLSFQPCIKHHTEDKKISSSKVISWKGIEFGLKKPNDNPKKKCNKAQDTPATPNKNNAMGKPPCLHIESNDSERLDIITQKKSFDKVDLCKDLSKHKSDKYMGFKIKKTCNEKNKSQGFVNSCTKISKTKSGQIVKTAKRHIKTKTKIATKIKSNKKCLNYIPKKSVKIDQYLNENKEDEYDRDSKHPRRSECLKSKKEKEDSPRTSCKTLHSKSLQDMNTNLDTLEFPCKNVNLINSYDEHKLTTEELCTTGKEAFDRNQDCKSTDSALLVTEVKDLCTSEQAKSYGKYSTKVNSGIDKLSYKKKKGKHSSKKRCTNVIATVKVSQKNQNNSKTSETVSINNSKENIITKHNLTGEKSCNSVETPSKLLKSNSAVICPKISVKSAQRTTKLINQSKLIANKSCKGKINKDSFPNTNSNRGKYLTETRQNSSKSQTSKTMHPSCQKTSQSQDRVEKKAYDTKSSSKSISTKHMSSTANAYSTNISRSSNSSIQNKSANICSLLTHKNKTKEEPIDSNIISGKSFSELNSINYLESNNNKTENVTLKKSSCNEELQINIPQYPESENLLFYETINNKNNSSNLTNTAVLKNNVEWYIKSPINHLQESALKAGELKQNGSLTLNSIKYKHNQGIYSVTKRGTVLQNEEKETPKLKTLYTIPNIPETNAKKHKIENLNKNQVFTDTFVTDKTLLYNGNKLKDKHNKTKVEDSKIFQNLNKIDEGLNKNTLTNIGYCQINHLQNLVNYNDKEYKVDDANIVSNMDHKAKGVNTQIEKLSNDSNEVGPNSRQLYQRNKNNQITHSLIKTARVSANNHQTPKECLRETNKITTNKMNTPIQNSNCCPLYCNKFSSNAIPRQNKSGGKGPNIDTKNKSTPSTNLKPDQINKSSIETFKIKNIGYKSKSAETRATNTKLPFFSEQNHYKNAGTIHNLKMGIKKYKVSTQNVKSSILHDKKDFIATNIDTNNFTNSNKFDEKVNFSRPKTSHLFSNPYKKEVQNRDDFIKYFEISLSDLKNIDHQKVNLKETFKSSSMKNKNKTTATKLEPELFNSNELKNNEGVKNSNNLDHLKNNQQGSLVSGKTFVVDKRLRKIIKKNKELKKNIVKQNCSKVQECNEINKNSNATSNKLVNKTVLKDIDYLLRDSNKPNKERTVVVIKNKANTPGKHIDKEMCNSQGSFPIKKTSHSNKFGQTTRKSKNDCISDLNRRTKPDIVAHQTRLNQSKTDNNLNLKAGVESRLSTPCQLKKIPATK